MGIDASNKSHSAVVVLWCFGRKAPERRPPPDPPHLAHQAAPQPAGRVHRTDHQQAKRPDGGGVPWILGRVPGQQLDWTELASTFSARIPALQQPAIKPSTRNPHESRQHAGRLDSCSIFAAGCLDHRVPTTTPRQTTTTIPASVDASKGRERRAPKQSPSIATHSPTSYSSRTPGRPTPTHFPIASHPAPRAISARPAQRLPKNSALNLPKNKNNEQRPSDFLRQTAFFLFPHSRPPWLTRRTQTMSSTPSPC
jgi:hypothetical protein